MIQLSEALVCFEQNKHIATKSEALFIAKKINMQTFYPLDWRCHTHKSYFNIYSNFKQLDKNLADKKSLPDLSLAE